MDDTLSTRPPRIALITTGGTIAGSANSATELSNYSAGRLADPLAGFTAPFANLRASYTVYGGDVVDFSETTMAEIARSFETKEYTDVAAALTSVLNEQGYVASLQPVASGTQLCQYHCPVAHVARAFPELCAAETRLFSELLGSHVQRLATIAHGDGVCTTHVPRPLPTPRIPRRK